MARAQNINPKILAWARESAALSREDAAARLGLTSSEGLSAVEKLAELEAGSKFPTRNQLTKFASVYRRPLITFYMKHPPEKGVRGEDFRTLPSDVSPRDNALLDTLLRDIRARQEIVKSLLEDEDETEPLPFVGSASISDGVQSVVGSIAAAIGISLDERRRRIGNSDDLFRQLRQRTEQIGVFVLLVGDLGSHHSSIGEGVFRGFAIADKIAPFIVINDQDAKSARSFTLLHELTHIWLGRTGISGSVDATAPLTPSGKIEQFCNDVASELLLPSQSLQAKPKDFDGSNKEEASQAIRDIAETWSVSEPMVAYRLSRIGLITKSVYRELAKDYDGRWSAFKEKDKGDTRETEGGPSYYTVKQFKLGNALIDVVRRTLRNNELTHTKAAKLLGVKPSSVEPLISRFEGSRGALIPNLRR